MRIMARHPEGSEGSRPELERRKELCRCLKVT